MSSNAATILKMQENINIKESNGPFKIIDSGFVAFVNSKSLMVFIT